MVYLRGVPSAPFHVTNILLGFDGEPCKSRSTCYHDQRKETGCRRKGCWSLDGAYDILSGENGDLTMTYFDSIV